MRLRTVLLLVATACVCSVVSADPAADSFPTFHRDIERILMRSCQDFHRPGQIGPMSLIRYEEVRPWAKSIKKQVLSREMPPFHAKGPIGRYLEDPRLTEEEIAKIARWVDQGSPRGNPAQQPAPRRW